MTLILNLEFVFYLPQNFQGRPFLLILSYLAQNPISYLKYKRKIIALETATGCSKKMPHLGCYFSKSAS